MNPKAHRHSTESQAEAVGMWQEMDWPRTAQPRPHGRPGRCPFWSDVAARSVGRLHSPLPPSSIACAPSHHRRCDAKRTQKRFP